MDYKLGWNYLVSEYKKNYDAQEDKIQTLWESYFSMPFVFSYTGFDEIDAKRSLHIGSKDREIPDIILRSNNKDLCIIELKRYSLPRNSDYEKQLLNYMAHTDLRLSVGVLICKTICIYYYNQSTNEKESIEIPFIENSNLGEKFIELFSKENFSENKIKSFIESCNNSKDTIDKIKSEINVDLINELLKLHFNEKYDNEIVEKVIKDLHISLNKDVNMEETNNMIPSRNTLIRNPVIKSDKQKIILNGTEIPVYRNAHQSVQDFIKQTLTTLFNRKILSENEILLLQDKSYSQRIFDIQFPLLEKNHSNTIDNTGHSRYWENFRVNGFYVCSQWWKQKFDTYDRLIANWLISLEDK